MNNGHHTLLSLAAFALGTTTAQAGTIISETFAGSESTDLVGSTTPDGNNWTGGLGETARQKKSAAATATATAREDESTTDVPTTAPLAFAVRQDGATSGTPFTAYHKFTLKQGQVYTLEAVLSPTNKADNQWFTAGFCVTARDGSREANLDGCTTYGQTVLSGSGYRYGWTGPDTKDQSELKGPGLHTGPVKVVLDTSKAKDYTIELFDGEGESIHGPKSIGAPAITQVFIGNSNAEGKFTKFTLSDDTADPEPKSGIKTAPETETETESETQTEPKPKPEPESATEAEVETETETETETEE